MTFECTICHKMYDEIDIEETFIGFVCVKCDDRCYKKAFGQIKSDELKL